MAKARPTGTAHQPTISPEMALKRLQRLLEQIPEVRSSGHDSASISTWGGNVKIVLADFFGESSLPFKEFNGIWFSPGVYYDGQPKSDFVKAFNSGLDRAKGFLESRVNELRERTEQANGSSAFSSGLGPDSRRIFVVHGHDHGSKETVARFLESLGLEPIVLHEQPDQGRTIIEKFEDHAADVQCAVVTEYSTAEDEGLPWDDEEQRYFPDSFDIHEVFYREFGGAPGNNAELREDLLDAFSDEVWCQKDAMSLTRREGLSSGWQNFCHNIKHDTRYLFFGKKMKSSDGDREFVPPEQMLSELGDLVQEFQLMRVLKQGSTYYRVRWDREGKTYSSPADLGPPPANLAGQSRMSAAGIPMMYLATNKEVALAETKDSSEGAASIATFRLTEEVTLLEVVKIPGVPSILGAGGPHLRDNLKFLWEFRQDISRPIQSDKRIHYEYSPTQVVTEYFRHAFAARDGKALEGVAYPSSRENGDNLVLFFDRANVVGVEDDFLSRQGRKRVELIGVELQFFAPGRKDPS